MRYPEHFRVRRGLGQMPQQARIVRSANGSFGRIRGFVGTQTLLASNLTLVKTKSENERKFTYG